MIQHSQLLVRAELQALPAIAQHLLAAVHAARLPKRSTYRIRLAVEEVCTNIIIHGYKAHGLSGHITITTAFDPDHFRVVIADEAPPFDPRDQLAQSETQAPLEEREEGGLGLFLVSCSIDHFDYRRTGNRNHHILEIRRPHDDGIRLLSALDDHHIAEAAAHQLEAVIDVVDDTRLIARKVSQNPYDLILVDEPGSIPSQLSAIRVSQGRKPIPQVLARVSSSHGEAALSALSAGCVDVFSDDISPTLLAHRIRLLVTRSRALHHQEHQDLERLAHDLTQVILPLGIALSQETDSERLMDRIVTEAMAICRADAGTYYRLEGETLVWAVMHNRSLGFSLGGPHQDAPPYPPLHLYSEGGHPNLTNVATCAVHEKRTLVIEDVYGEDARDYDFQGARAFDLQLGYRSQSIVTVPVYSGSSITGVLQLINAQDEEGQVVVFSSYQIQVIESFASQASVVLTNHHLARRQEVLLQLERDLQIGRQIQSNFFPATLPEVPGYELEVRFAPAREVSGDFYDVISLPYGCLGFVVADVCDKGVGAAMFMGLIRSLLRAFAQTDWSESMMRPNRGLSSTTLSIVTDETIFERVKLLLHTGVVLTNDYIANNHRDLDMFATLFFGVLMPSSGALAFINAGHLPFQIWTSEGVRALLRPTGPAIGIIPGAQFAIDEVRLLPEELLLGYTDGIADARDKGGERLGEHTLAKLIQAQPLTADAVLSRIEEGIARHTGNQQPYDDITMLALRRHPSFKDEP